MTAVAPHHPLTDVHVKLNQLAATQERIMAALDDLKTQEAATEAAMDKAIAAIQADTQQIADLSAKIAAITASDDTAALVALAAAMKAKTDALTAVLNPPAPASAPAAASPPAAASAAPPASAT